LPVLTNVVAGGQHHSSGVCAVRQISRIDSARASHLRGDEDDEPVVRQITHSINQAVGYITVIGTQPQPDDVNGVDRIFNHVTVDDVHNLLTEVLVNVIVPTELLDDLPGLETELVQIAAASHEILRFPLLCVTGSSHLHQCARTSRRRPPWGLFFDGHCRSRRLPSKAVVMACTRDGFVDTRKSYVMKTP